MKDHKLKKYMHVHPLLRCSTLVRALVTAIPKIKFLKYETQAVGTPVKPKAATVPKDTVRGSSLSQ